MPETIDNVDAKATVASLLEKKSPVLVEIRFPNAATSSDWQLCQDEDEFESLIQRLGPGTEVRISSVWDLPKSTKEIVLRK